MENFEFKSQICTTREQSERLLKLGFKKETADMVWIKELALDEVVHCTYDAETYMLRPIDYLEGESHRGYIPAWSLHRLIEILGPHRLPIHFRKKGRVDITVSHINPTHSGRGIYNYYDSIIDCIEWLRNHEYAYVSYFNKDYLEEKK